VARYLADCNVEIHEGYFPATAQMLEFLKLSFVHLDADLYETTKDALDFFVPRMVPGGVLILDDWKWSGCPGVEKAVTEGGLTERVEETASGQGRIRF
jgi:O-methyltransferase